MILKKGGGDLLMMEQGHENMCSFDDKEIKHKRV